MFVMSADIKLSAVAKFERSCILNPTIFFLSSVVLLSTFLSHTLLLLSLFSPSPPFPFPSFEDLADDDAAHSNDVHGEVNGRPVVDGVRGFQQHKAHAHIVVRPHL